MATFVISDVPGDDVGAIASGPTVPDPTTQADALRILEKYRYPALPELGPILRDARWETPKPGDPTFALDTVHLIATAATALAAAARFLEQQGFRVVQLGDDLDDEAQALGREHARLAKQTRESGQRTAILSGGDSLDEHMPEVEQPGADPDDSSRAQQEQFHVPAARTILPTAPRLNPAAGMSRWPPIPTASKPRNHAGGIVVPETLRLGAARDSVVGVATTPTVLIYLDACGSLLQTRPTRTNVNDFRLILCEA